MWGQKSKRNPQMNSTDIAILATIGVWFLMFLFLWVMDVIAYYTSKYYRLRHGRPFLWPFKYGKHG